MIPKCGKIDELCGGRVKMIKMSSALVLEQNSCSLHHTPCQKAKSLPLTLTDYGHFLARSGYFTERSGQDDFLLFFTHSGKGYLKYRSGEYLLHPGHAVIIYCKEYQYYRTEEELWDFKWIHFNGPGGHDYMSLLNESGLNPVRLHDPERLEELFGLIPPLMEPIELASDVRLSAVLTEIVSLILLSNLHLPAYRTPTEQEIHKVIRYIRQNHHRKLTLAEILADVPFSRFHFSRLFKKHTGLSIFEYLLNYRINTSKTLLKETEFSVAEIGEKVGFGNPTNYIREFKKVVGMTPLQYRIVSVLVFS